MHSLIQSIERIDRQVLITLNQMQNSIMNHFMIFITKIGGLVFQAILVMSLLLFPTTRTLGIKLAIVQISVTILIQILKATIARVRPYNILNDIKALKKERDFSFPSGHSAASFTTAIVIGSFIPVISLGCLSLATFIGYSRMYIGVPYPSDVIAGSLIGILTTVLLLSII